MALLKNTKIFSSIFNRLKISNLDNVAFEKILNFFLTSTAYGFIT